MTVYAYFDEYGEWHFFDKPDEGFEQLCADGCCAKLEITSDGHTISLKSDSNDEGTFNG